VVFIGTGTNSASAGSVGRRWERSKHYSHHSHRGCAILSLSVGPMHSQQTVRDATRRRQSIYYIHTI
jgi:hypothetical protein